MASNNDRASLPQRAKSNNKNNTDSHLKLLNQLTEMFGSIFEQDIIKSVAQNCNWNLDSSIDAFITLSGNTQTITTTPNKTEDVNYDPWKDEKPPWEEIESTVAENSPTDEVNLSNIKESELLQQQQDLTIDESKQLDSSLSSLNLNEPSQKVETASLCGLKVQYRPRGMESNSDDDADVVIEEESCDYRADTSESEPVNVCQFLTLPTQCSSTNTFSKINYVRTPSPPCTPCRVPTSLPARSQDKLPDCTNNLETDIKRGYKILILMRGVPGSGKSYLARSIVTNTVGNDFTNHIFSTDDYFSKINRGVYVHDASKLSDAHNYNQNRVFNAMRQGRSPIIVDNTNTQAWEMRHYAIMAVEHGYIVETLESNTPWASNINELYKRNSHNVPKAKIRLMLNRYESNINGKKLLQMFGLTYAPHNQPPQIRELPPITIKLDSLSEKQININTTNYSVPTHQMIDSQQKFVSEDQNKNKEPEHVIDNNGLNTIAKEYANLGIEFNNSSNKEDSNSNFSNIKPTKEYWTEGSFYKEDSLSDLMKLGAIGSERKVVASNSNDDENSLDFIKNNDNSNTEESVTLAMDPIRKDSEHIVRGHKVNKEEQSNIMSQCWDFTLLLENGGQIHSITELEPEDFSKSEDRNEEEVQKYKKTFINNGEVTYVLVVNEDTTLSLNEKIKNPTEEKKTDTAESKELEESFVTDLLSKEPSSSSDRTSSKNSSLERVSDVDISQFEICNSDTLSDYKRSNEELLKEVNPEKKSSGAVDSIFSYIKNSLLGTDKENHNDAPLNNADDKIDYNLAHDELIDKLRNSDSSCCSSGTKSNEEVDSPVISFQEISSDTQPERLSIANSDSGDESNINCDVQKTDNLFECKRSYDDTDNSQKNNSEVTISPDILKENVTNVVEQLLEASSDVHPPKQLNFTTEEQKLCNAMSEKIFVEQTKNLQMHEKIEGDDNKVSKEPVDKIFVNKNIFNGKIQNNISSATKPFDNSSVDNINLISWRESPFPLDSFVYTSSEDSKETEKKPQTCDRETYTDPYDFNVSYIGGTSEYKVIEAFNRSINERFVPNETPSLPSRILMLHKGTMTNNTSIFHKEAIFDLEIGDEDLGDNLVQLFSHLPQSFVLDIYKNLCRCDFTWAVDYLSTVQKDDAVAYSLVNQNENVKDNLVPSNNIREDNMEEIAHRLSLKSPQTTESSTEHSSPQASRNKRNKYKSSYDNLELKQELESKFILSEESYTPHMLRVKRWKNGDFDEPMSNNNLESNIDDIQSKTSVNDFLLPMQTSEKPSRLDHPAVEEHEDEENEDDESLEESDEEEVMELNLGYDFIRVLESEFGNSNFQSPDGLFPVIQIRKSMAQEIHALWIESMQQQLWAMQEQLDAVIAKDAQYARSLEAQEEAGAIYEPKVPNLKEIMDMEMALAMYNNDCVSKQSKMFKKNKFRKETQKDMALRVAQQLLFEMFPNYDREMLMEIYEAHGRNFDETVKIIEENCSSKSTMTMADVLKKRKNLIDELQKESSYQTSYHNELEMLKRYEEVFGKENEDEEPLTYEDAMESASDSRAEARRQLGLRNQNYQKARDACRQKNPEVAAYYSDVAKLHIRKMEMANSAAASAFLAAQTQMLEASNTLDLHFLHLREAKEALDVFLDYQLSQMTPGSHKYFYIITGRGSRSLNGRSKLKPAITKKLNNRNIRFSEANPGMLKIVLRK